MISAVCWVPKGASKAVPVVTEPPSKEEIEILNTCVLERNGDSEEEENEDMDVSTSKEVDEGSHALAAAKALSKTQGNKHYSGSQDISDGLRELDLDRYDEEEDGVELFSTGQGDTYYISNEMDPYLQNKDDDDDDDEEIEDMTIKPTDAVIVCARNEDEVSHLEVWIFEEMEDEEPNMYVHHDIILPAFPLCTAWLDCNLKSADKALACNYIAVGSMEAAIEIWDLDLLDEVQPFRVLGGVSQKKKKKGKKASVQYKEGSHKDSVLGLAWNKEVRNVLASASADKSVKTWDMNTGECVVTMEHHTDKVQAVAWNRQSPELLLSGSFDQSVIMMDMRSGALSSRWSVTADVESLAWDPHTEKSFVVSLDNGTVQGFDIRASTSNSSSGPKPSFTIHAHDKAVSSISYNPCATNLMATGSTDKMVKLWDLSNNQPSCVASRNLKAGAVFSISFSEDSPFLLAIGGSKGKMKVWDTLMDPGVARSFGKFSNRRSSSTKLTDIAV